MSLHGNSAAADRRNLTKHVIGGIAGPAGMSARTATLGKSSRMHSQIQQASDRKNQQHLPTSSIHCLLLMWGCRILEAVANTAKPDASTSMPASGTNSSTKSIFSVSSHPAHLVRPGRRHSLFDLVIRRHFKQR